MTQDTYAQFGAAPGPFVTRRIDEFTQGYLEAVAFTETDNPDTDVNGLELSEDALAMALDDCESFQVEAGALLSEAYQRDYTPAQAGRDFWFTRNGAGVGFWDRKELDAGELGTRLSDLCGYHTDFPLVDVYPGDDGKAYFA